MTRLALFLHLLAVLAFFAGIVVAGAAFEVGRRRERPSEVAAVLTLARVAVPLVAAGFVAVLATGLWLVPEIGRSYGEPWLSASFALLALAGLLGVLGGRRPKRARLLAGRLAGEGSGRTAELDRLLADRATVAANYAALLVTLAILALMVWRPGG